MRNIWNWFQPQILKHLSDEQILTFLDGELSQKESETARDHFESCWRCRARREQLETTIFSLVEYRQSLLEPFLPPPPFGEDRLLSRIEQDRKRQPNALGHWIVSRFGCLRDYKMNPTMASVVVIAVAIAALFIIWQRNTPTVSANELLGKAQTWDNQRSEKSTPGVIYQEISIRVGKKKFHRTLYRDRQGMRKPKPESISYDPTIEAQFEIANVNWNEPLSVSNYKTWHDALPSDNDKVSRSGKDLLTVTTTNPNGIVSRQSLTVRRHDFHPVERTVDVVGIGEIEIAELNYAILDWDAVNEALFEPFQVSVPVTPMTTPVRARTNVPLSPTPTDLDGAELRAWLALNEIGADAGEQVRITRLPDSVEIRGIVDTDKRKNELLNAVGTIRYLRPSILSVEELNANPSSQLPITSVRGYSVNGQFSPLAQYLKDMNSSSDALSRTSKNLLEASLQTQHAAAALSNLVERFPESEQLKDAEHGIRNHLITNYIRAISAELDTQVVILGETHLSENATIPADDGQLRAEHAQSEDVNALTMEVNHSAILCQELIAGSEAVQRPASAIAKELSQSLARARILLSELEVRLISKQ
jgi:hypothetical protein